MRFLSTLARRSVEPAGLLLYFAATLGPPAWLGVQAAWRAGAAGAWFAGQFGARLAALSGKSLALAAVVTLCSTLLGLGSALWMVSHSGPAARLARKSYFAPFIIPSYIYALTWMSLLSRSGPLAGAVQRLFGQSPSPYGFGGTAVILSLVFAPLVTLLALAALEAIEPELVEMALTLGPARRAWGRVILPLTIPALGAAAGLVFALALVEYGVPALLQYNVYAMEIYAEFSQSGDPQRALLLALPAPALALLLISSSQGLLRRTPLAGRAGGSRVLRGLSLPPAAAGLALLGILSLAAGVLLPVSMLALQTGGLQTGFLRAVLPAVHDARQDLLTSLLLAGSAALGAGVLAFLPARRAARSRSGWAWAALLAPLAIPAPLLGIGLISLANQLPGAAQRSPLVGLALLWAAHVGRFLPLALAAMAAQFRRVDPLLLEMARLHPVGRLRRLRLVELPLLAGGIGAALALVFTLSLGEIGATLLVIPPGLGTVALRLFTLLHYGAAQSTAGLALCLLGIVLGLGASFLGFWERYDRNSADR